MAFKVSVRLVSAEFVEYSSIVPKLVICFSLLLLSWPGKKLQMRWWDQTFEKIFFLNFEWRHFESWIFHFLKPDQSFWDWRTIEKLRRLKKTAYLQNLNVITQIIISRYLILLIKIYEEHRSFYIAIILLLWMISLTRSLRFYILFEFYILIVPNVRSKWLNFFLQSFSELIYRPLLVDLTVEEGSRLKVIYGSAEGFHAVDLDLASVYDIYLPKNVSFHVSANAGSVGWIYAIGCLIFFFFPFLVQTQGPISPHCIVTLPNSNGMQLLLCYDNEGVYVNTHGKVK